MGGCCCKSASVVQPDSPGSCQSSPAPGTLGSRVRQSYGSSNATPYKPNLFRVLQLEGLDEEGDVGRMRASYQTCSPAKSDATSGLLAGAGDGINDETTVKVAVLVRPLMDFEKQKGNDDIVQLPGPGKIQLPAKPSGGVADANGAYTFDFDAAYRMDSGAVSRAMFKGLVLRVAERFCQGFNGTVLAYGQTGSGKTYTMGTGGAMREALQKNATGHIGLLPRLMTALFGYVKAASEKYDITVKVQFVEIINENLQDLLRTYPPALGLSSTKLDIREAADGEVMVEGAAQVLVSSAADLAAAIDHGTAARATASHKMNEHSSRSHAIVTLIMEQRVRPELLKDVPPELAFLRSRLHLVDLAGSERVKDTGAEGARFAEGVSINKGLLELGNVINALTEQQQGKKRVHIPYRNSKLTRVLQDSLGGNAETLMLACVSPATTNHEQTLNTLRYAQRARAIKNQLRLNNQQTVDEELSYLRAMVTRLQNENNDLRSKLAALGR